MKEKFIKSTIILVVGGILTKILSMVIRIITTRLIGTTGIGLYMLIMPTFNLFITIGTMSMPTAISKVISEGDKNSKSVIVSTIIFALLFNALFLIVIFLLAPFISTNLLNNSSLYYPILMTGLTLPFITISSIIRGYLFGKEKMFPHVLSNLAEQVIRIILLFLIIPNILFKGIIYVICFLVLFNIASEIISTIIMLLFISKKISIKKEDLRISFSSLKDVFSVSIPTTIGRLISSIGLFLEPVIITFVCLKIGYDNGYIIKEYGIISGYVMPMVTMPCFLTGAISQSILPIVSKYYKANKISFVKEKVNKAIKLSLFLGVIATFVMFFFPEVCLRLIFNTTYGSSYLKFASLVFFISYIEGPIVAILQGIDESKSVMISSMIGMFLKTITLFLVSYLDLGMYPLIISYFIYYVFTIIYQVIVLKNKFN